MVQILVACAGAITRTAQPPWSLPREVSSPRAPTTSPAPTAPVATTTTHYNILQSCVTVTYDYRVNNIVSLTFFKMVFGHPDKQHSCICWKPARPISAKESPSSGDQAATPLRPKHIWTHFRLFRLSTTWTFTHFHTQGQMCRVESTVLCSSHCVALENFGML